MSGKQQLTKWDYLRLRNRYKPVGLNTVFILESPLASRDYFYDQNGRMTEPLFSSMMKLLHFIPLTKTDGLEYFSETGHFLVHATYKPVNRMTDKARNDTIISGYDDLVYDLESLGNRYLIRFVLIKANICRLLEPKLKKDGFKVVNNGVVVPFPSNGQKEAFRKKISEVFAFNAHITPNCR